MSLLEKACKVYDLNEKAGRIGVLNTQEKEPMAPISHILTKAQIQITLDADGQFVSAEVVAKEDSRTIIPVTTASAGRTSSAKDCPHPMSDQLMFFSYDLGGNCDKYREQLASWEESPYTHPKLTAIRRYVEKGTVLPDLIRSGIVEVDEDGHLTNGKIEATEYRKCLIRWVVYDTGDYDEAWRDQSLFASWIGYYHEILHTNQETLKGLCGVTYEDDAILADSHPKGIQPLSYGAKLISSNDSTNFTYRGRFRTPDEAVSIGYTASQKSHSALRWLESNQGVQIGNRRFLWWKLPEKPESTPFENFNVIAGFGKTEPERVRSFRDQLQKALTGHRMDGLTQDETVIVLAIEAATTGRLSVTYYNEMGAFDFASRLSQWYTDMAYNEAGFTPTFRQVISYAFGSQRGEFVEADDRIMAENTQRMLQCVVDGAHLPSDIVFALIHKFSQPLNYSDKNLRRLQNITFAAVKKHRNETYKEEWNLELDQTCTDRSYLYGRLLAVAEKLEADTYGEADARMTNAIRMQTIFAQHPDTTWKALCEKLIPYKQRLMKSRPGSYRFYERLIGEISAGLTVDDPRWNRPLDEKYILGYYHQRSAFYQKKSADTPDEDEMNEE